MISLSCGFRRVGRVTLKHKPEAKERESAKAHENDEDPANLKVVSRRSGGPQEPIFKTY